MALKEPLQPIAVEVIVARDQLNEAGKIGEEIALVPVGQDGGHGGWVEFDVVVVYFDEADSTILCDQGKHGRFYLPGYLALQMLVTVSYRSRDVLTSWS